MLEDRISFISLLDNSSEDEDDSVSFSAAQRALVVEYSYLLSAFVVVNGKVDGTNASMTTRFPNKARHRRKDCEVLMAA